VTATDDVDCLKRDGKARRRHVRRGSPQLGNLADSNQREFRSSRQSLDALAIVRGGEAERCVRIDRIFDDK